MLSTLVLSNENRLLIMGGSPHLYRWGGCHLQWIGYKTNEEYIPHMNMGYHTGTVYIRKKACGQNEGGLALSVMTNKPKKKGNNYV